MGAPIIRTHDWHHHDYDMIIDVRSPVEFTEDHITGAVNMPCLSDEERDIVGTLYKQQSAFEARKTGAAFTARNIARHIERFLQDKPADFTPLIHCWRGGQRSRAFAQICSEIGWKSYVLEGGYKYYRTRVLDGLKTLPQPLKLIIIAGRTGSAKTKLLYHLKETGQQILDLEGLANHRGSLLGKSSDPQPSQKQFESHLFSEMTGFDTTRPVFVESESSRIGDVHIPKMLWHQMIAAPLILVTSDRRERASYLVEEYPHLLTDQQDLNRLIEGMVFRHGKAETARWKSLMEQENWLELAETLLSHHYDPAYDQSVLRHQRDVLAELPLGGYHEKGLRQTAAEIISLIEDKNNIT